MKDKFKLHILEMFFIHAEGWINRYTRAIALPQYTRWESLSRDKTIDWYCLALRLFAS